MLNVRVFTAYVRETPVTATNTSRDLCVPRNTAVAGSVKWDKHALPELNVRM